MSFWRRLIQHVSSSPLGADWEAVMIEADFGSDLAEAWAQEMQCAGQDASIEKAEIWIRQKMKKILADSVRVSVKAKPEVILLVGVNGSGKTTTAGKLAAHFKKQDRRVHLAAADTFRAAAAEQLQSWGDRLHVPVTRSIAGADPASVAVQAWLKADQENADILLIDTAGRQANKHNLLSELEKIKRSLQKKNPQLPQHTWLVLDGTTGRAALDQAHEFNEAVRISGLIVTKLDSSARGGMIVALQYLLKLKTYFIGKGEGLEDLEEFDAEKYINNFFIP